MAPALFVILPKPQKENWQASLPQHIQDQLAASSLNLLLECTTVKNDFTHIFIAMFADCRPEAMTLCNQHEGAKNGYLSAWATLACPWPVALEFVESGSSIPVNDLANDVTARDLLSTCVEGMTLLIQQQSAIQHRSRQHVKAGGTHARRWKALLDCIQRVINEMSQPGSASSSHNVTAQNVLQQGLMCDLKAFFEEYNRQSEDEQQHWPAAVDFLLQERPPSYGPKIRPGFDQEGRIQANVVLKFLPHNMRQQLVDTLPNMHVLCVLLGVLARSPGQIKKNQLKVDRLFINQGQLDEAAYQPQSFKTHLVWMISMCDLEGSAISGHFRVVHLNSMNKIYLLIFKNILN